ncbi:MAG: histidine phosphatase family protein [Burkholderiales bacterium]|nr:histidine phosphatase family protein [Burkholderiales bacterium]
MPTRICFIRHGETDWNVEKRIQGQTDIALNETGKRQAVAMAFNAAHHQFSAIYSSDLVRAFDTASMLAARRELEVVRCSELRERHYGIFQGITAAQGEVLHPRASLHYRSRDADYDFETGESLHDFAGRVGRAVDAMRRHHAGQTIAAVTHAGVLDILYRRATGRPLHTPRDFSIPNCALNWFHIDDHGLHLEKWDDHHHLTQVLKESAE